MSGWAILSTTAPGARVPRSTADQPPPEPIASGQRSAVTLGPRDRLIGQLHIDGDVRLGGTVEGEIHATGDVEIDDEAKVNASLAGGDVSIRGHVNGHVTARKRLVVARSGSLIGDVRVARLVIQDGASFSGNVSMGAQSTASTESAEPKAAPAVQQAVRVAQATPVVQAAPHVVEAAPKVQAAPSSSDGKDKAGAAAGRPGSKDIGSATGKGKPAPVKGKPKR
jgi:cytoskeletal protein CcmA (bactofilin family)